MFIQGTQKFNVVMQFTIIPRHVHSEPEIWHQENSFLQSRLEVISWNNKLSNKVADIFDGRCEKAMNYNTK